MSLTESLVRACFPALMATRFTRRLPGRIGPLLGRRFLRALKMVNQERLAAAENSGSGTFAAYPGFITVAGTSRCNIRCEFCINQWDAAPDGSNRPHMTELHIDTVCREVLPYVRKIALSVSGEPLYDPHFMHLLEQAQRYDVFVEFTTNGMLVSKPGFREAILDHVGRVNFSMDGATPETYERLRQGARFDKVCDNIRSLTEGRRERGQATPEFNIRYILMTETIDELPTMVDLAKDLGVDHLFTNHLQVFMEALAPQSLMFHKERTNKALTEARARAAARDMVAVLPDNFDMQAANADGDRESGSAASVEVVDEATALAAFYADMKRAESSVATAVTNDAPAATEPAATKPATSGSGDGFSWAASGTVERSLARPEELPPSAYINRCSYLWDQAFFEADGSIFPCCNSGGVGLGHLDRARDFYEIWAGQAYRNMRETVYTPKCHDICVNCYLREETAASAAYLRPVEGAERGGWKR